MPTLTPPDVPANVPRDVAEYLRRLNLWAYQEIDKKVSKDEATPHVILSASDQTAPPSAFMLTVNHTGTLTTASVPIGKGKP